MPEFIHKTLTLLRKVYTLARPYGLKRLAAVGSLALAQAVFQVLGVTSIFPFLAIAANPERIRNSNFGTLLLSGLPPMDNDRMLLWSGVFALVMLMLSAGMNLVAEYVRNFYTHGFGHWLRLRLLRRIVARPYGYFLQENSGVLVKKVVGDVSSFTGGILLPLLDSLARFTTIVLLVITLLLVHPWIALATTVGLSIYYVGIYRLLDRRRDAISEQLKLAGRGVYQHVQQLIGGIKTVKVHRVEEPFIEDFSRHSSQLARANPWVPIYGNAPRYLIEPLAFGGLVLAVLIYAGRGQDISAILPNLGVMALAGYRLLPAIQILYAQFTQISTTLYALDEVYEEFLQVEQDTQLDQQAAQGLFPQPPRLEWSDAIVIDKLGFTYPGAARPVIANLSLHIPKNSSLGIVGQTGCGKSTLVDILLGLHRSTSGQILVDGQPLGPENLRAWRAGIGYVPQDIFLIDDTIAANIAFGLPKNAIDRAALREAAAAAQILDFIERETPSGWDTVVGERGVRLSGGQRQRIGLARALYHRPELLVLDEATSALDVSTETEVMRAIDALQGRLTLVIIAHRTSTVQKCGTILKMGRPPAAASVS
jgi:ATP-binding cassette, subfamily B, bacterial PglK